MLNANLVLTPPKFDLSLGRRGTSLAVKPFAALVSQVRPGSPRLLINRERVGEGTAVRRGPVGPAGPFDFDGFDGLSCDGFVQGDCDSAVLELAQLLGWEAELDALVALDRATMQRSTNDASREKAYGDSTLNSIDCIEPPPPHGFIWSGLY